MSYNVADIELFLEKADISFDRNVNLKRLSYFKTGGRAKYIIRPTSKPGLIKILLFFRKKGFPFKIIGNMTNLLFLDDIEYTCFIDIRKINAIAYLGEGEFEADLGVSLPDLSRNFLFQEISGAEGLEGIPGTLGAAILMNAGAYGSKISDILLNVEALSPDGEIVNYNRDDLYFGHRDSTFKSERINDVILSCRLKGLKGDRDFIYDKMSLFHNKRHKYQEWMYPNLGSLFTASIYRYLGKKSLRFRLLSSLYVLINYKLKPFRRESPDNRMWLNRLVEKTFKLDFDNRPYSPKDLNTLINNGHHTDEILSYIHKIKKITDNKIQLENEIVHKF